MITTAAPNRSQSDNWNHVSGPTWVELQAMLDRMLEAFVAPLLEAAVPGPGQGVLDVGCGAGATTLAAAGCVGAEGRALGVDISAPLVAAAQARAEAVGAPNAAFVCADAQTYAFEAEGFDAVISRFGIMFFDDPEAAFANLRRAARPGARLAFVAWRSPADNPFMTAAVRAATPLLPPTPPADPHAPGQFAFADAERVRRILAAAGWSAINVAPLDLPSVVAESDLMTYVTRMGPVGAALRESDEATRTAVIEALRAEFTPFVQDGAARFTSACWFVSGRAS